MKTNKIARFALATVASLALTAALAFPSGSMAADQLKGAQRQIGEKPVAVLAPAVVANSAATLAMCATCTDKTKVVALKDGKAASAKSIVTTTHQCPTCKTAIKTVGGGKAKADVAVHTCGSGMVATCCGGMAGM